ncbi:hypothetical protein HDU97_006826 [Phlyctochytrium planicorne]|nr:hypothetical protein HDU97_006826 [Phlyctochytrium planicorne]
MQSIGIPSLQIVQATLLTAAVASVLGHGTTLVSLSGIALRMAEYLDNGELESDEEDSEEKDVWLRCLHMCFLLNDAVSVLNLRSRFFETRTQVEDAVWYWTHKYNPSKPIPLILLQSAAISIIQTIQSLTSEIPVDADALLTQQVKLASCTQQLRIWKEGLPPNRQFDDRGEWMAKAESTIDSGKLLMYLTYHLARCMVFRSILVYAKTRGLCVALTKRYLNHFKLALDSAHCVSDAIGVVQGMRAKGWVVQPVHAFCFRAAGLVFSDMATLTVDSDKREEYLESLEIVVSLLKSLRSVLPVVDKWLGDIRMNSGVVS